MMPLNRRIFTFALRMPAPLTAYVAQVVRHVFLSDPEQYLRRIHPHLDECDRRAIDDPVYRDHLKRAFTEASHRYQGVIGQELALYARPWGMSLEALRVPVVLWHGARNRHIPVRLARRLARRIPDCDARILPDDGYYLPYRHWGEILGSLVGMPPAS